MAEILNRPIEVSQQEEDNIKQHEAEDLETEIVNRKRQEILWI